MRRFVSGQAADTVALGRAIGRAVQTRDVVALDGELGAGKTQFVRGLAEGMGLDPRQVSSPTFVFVQEYPPPPPPELEGQERETLRPVLVHIDAYRLDGPDQLESIGWGDELLAGAVLAVEWAPRIETTLGPDRLDVRIEHLGDDRRAITLTPHGRWVRRMDTMTFSGLQAVPAEATPSQDASA